MVPVLRDPHPPPPPPPFFPPLAAVEQAEGRLEDQELAGDRPARGQCHRGRGGRAREDALEAQEGDDEPQGMYAGHLAFPSNMEDGGGGGGGGGWTGLGARGGKTS